MLPQLNSDVLAHILSLMDDDSILVAMQTSRWLYTEAAKTLLQRPLMLDYDSESALVTLITTSPSSHTFLTTRTSRSDGTRSRT